jgi:Rhomboid family
MIVHNTIIMPPDCREFRAVRARREFLSRQIMTARFILRYAVLAQAGPSGSQFGILACLFVEIIHNWYIIRRPWLHIIKLSVILIVLFIFGLLPIIDNYAHLFGFLYGFLLAYPLMPFLGYHIEDRRLRIIGIATCSVLAVAVLLMLLLLFYVMPIHTCSICKYFNCAPFAPGLCESSEMHPHRVCNFSDVTCI